MLTAPEVDIVRRLAVHAGWSDYRNDHYHPILVVINAS